MTSTLPAQAGHDGNGALRMIPGAYEQNTLARRQPGAMGRAAHDADHMPAGAGTMSDVTIAERRKEGGGGISQRRAVRRHLRSRRRLLAWMFPPWSWARAASRPVPLPDADASATRGEAVAPPA